MRVFRPTRSSEKGERNGLRSVNGGEFLDCGIRQGAEAARRNEGPNTLSASTVE